VLVNVGNPASMLERHEVQAAAHKMSIEVISLEIRNPEDISRVLDKITNRADGLYVCADPLVNDNRMRINTLALGVRLPMMEDNREFVVAGGLICYGPNFPDLSRRSADFVDKILHGTKPSDIPVEQPIKFDLVVNLTTAKALGLTIPESFLSRADEVIE
jgi:putative tryptophan/tyrosine transport system substrate-binding protein